MPVSAPPGAQRRRFRVTGIVQGVGYRPWVHQTASRHGLSGFVLNDGRGVVIEAEGPPGALDAFEAELRTDPLPLARIDALEWRPISATGEPVFRVRPSRTMGGGASIPPDAATCDQCLQELFDPADRRHAYAFITCTACGPRFTVVRSVPYDRARTTMADFSLCEQCRSEYEDPADRRFHAETIACDRCGPRLSMPLHDAVALLLSGGIVAIKGLGGWHLACDAGDEDAVARLRARKRRDDKPFAVMTSDPSSLTEATDDDLALLRSPARPILLLPRRADAAVAADVAPGSPWLGVMLPYTPVHHLLIDGAGRPLVMTSGNRTDEPIAVTDAEAHERLADIADAFLGHDRTIHRRCEDSVMRSGSVIRRSRGLAPSALPLPVGARRPVLAVGAEFKATFCVAKGQQAFVSPHLGDLNSEEALRAYSADLRLYLEMLDVHPEAIVYDLHPDYRATRWALEQDGEPIGVQHHHAHAAACLAEHGEIGPALAVVLDGTGYGLDGTLWGGELLRCDLESFERLAHLQALPLPGGEAAIHEPWRMAAVHLEHAGRPVPWERWSTVSQALAVNAPHASGAGRLLDAAAALLGVREIISYEGQATVELEQLAAGVEADPYRCRQIGDVIFGADLIGAAHDDLHAGRPRELIAAAVHEGLAAAFAAACSESGGPGLVVLSGGCLQNVRLATSLRRRLEQDGFKVLTHERVPPNDGGISYGQAAVAAARMA